MATDLTGFELDERGFEVVLRDEYSIVERAAASVGLVHKCERIPVGRRLELWPSRAWAALRSQSAAADALSLPIGKKRDDSIDPQVLTSFFMALKTPKKGRSAIFRCLNRSENISGRKRSDPDYSTTKPVTLIAGTQRPAASVCSGFATKGANHI